MLSTKVFTHQLTLKDKRVFDLTYEIFNKIFPVFMNKDKNWDIPISIGGNNAFISGDMKSLISYDDINKQENQGRGYINEVFDASKFDTIKSTEEELTEIEKYKREGRLILSLYAKHPIPYIGYKIDNNMSSGEYIRRKEENRLQQQEAYKNWKELFKKSALEIKDKFVNTNYWFFKEGGHLDFIKEEFPVVARANVTGETEEEEVSMYEIAEKMFKS